MAQILFDGTHIFSGKDLDLNAVEWLEILSMQSL